MATLKIKLTIGELLIDFTDIVDLEKQLKDIDLSKIESMVVKETYHYLNNHKSSKTYQTDSQTVSDLGTINLLKISERGPDATKLAIFLASNKVRYEDIKRITGITLFS